MTSAELPVPIVQRIDEMTRDVQRQCPSADDSTVVTCILISHFALITALSKRGIYLPSPLRLNTADGTAMTGPALFQRLYDEFQSWLSDDSPPGASLN